MAAPDGARWTRPVGAATLVVAVVGGLLLWWFAGQRYDDAVAALAPAPIGCDTTLVFDRAGTYTVFVETRGRVGDIDGDCDADDRAYDVAAEQPPAVDVTLVDDQGNELDLDRADGPRYDRAGARGIGVRTVRIEDAGDYVLTADADRTDVMVRVGRDPSDGVTAMRVGAIAVLLIGLAGGVALLVAAGRQPAPVPPGPGPGPAWPPLPVRPPPTAPPYANPAIPPPYAAPPAAPSPEPRPGLQPPSRPVDRPPVRGRPLPPPRPPR